MAEKKNSRMYYVLPEGNVDFNKGNYAVFADTLASRIKTLRGVAARATDPEQQKQANDIVNRYVLDFAEIAAGNKELTAKYLEVVPVPNNPKDHYPYKSDFEAGAEVITLSEKHEARINQRKARVAEKAREKAAEKQAAPKELTVEEANLKAAGFPAKARGYVSLKDTLKLFPEDARLQATLLEKFRGREGADLEGLDPKNYGLEGVEPYTNLNMVGAVRKLKVDRDLGGEVGAIAAAKLEVLAFDVNDKEASKQVEEFVRSVAATGELNPPEVEEELEVEEEAEVETKKKEAELDGPGF